MRNVDDPLPNIAYTYMHLPHTLQGYPDHFCLLSASHTK